MHSGSYRPLLLQGCHVLRQVGWWRRWGHGGCWRQRRLLQQQPLLLQQGKVLLCQLLTLLQGRGRCCRAHAKVVGQKV